MVELGAARRPRGRLRAHRHGPAARPRGRQRARDRARRSPRCAARARPTSPSSCSTPRARLLRSPTSASTSTRARRRAEAAVADGSAVAAYERWIAGAGRRPRRVALPQAPGRARARPAPRAGHRHPARCARGRRRGAPPRRRPARRRATRRPRGRRRLPRKRGDRSRRASRSPRFTPATRAGDAAARGHRLLRIGDEAPARRPMCSSVARPVSDGGLGYAVPELPEVETVRRRLEPALDGTTLAGRDPRPAADAALRAAPGRRRARGGARLRRPIAAASIWLSLRERTGSPVHLRMTGACSSRRGPTGRSVCRAVSG